MGKNATALGLIATFTLAYVTCSPTESDTRKQDIGAPEATILQGEALQAIADARSKTGKQTELSNTQHIIKSYDFDIQIKPKQNTERPYLTVIYNKEAPRSEEEAELFGDSSSMIFIGLDATQSEDKQSDDAAHILKYADEIFANPELGKEIGKHYMQPDGSFVFEPAKSAPTPTPTPGNEYN